MRPEDADGGDVGTQPEVFEVPNLLKARASAAGGKTVDEMVDSGNAVVSVFAATYVEVARADISEIAAVAKAMRRSPRRADDLRPELMRIGLNLKGQAATMGHPVLTEVATSLTDFLDELQKRRRRIADDPKTALPAVQLHVEALRLLVSDPDARNGDTERQMIEGLKTIVARALPPAGTR